MASPLMATPFPWGFRTDWVSLVSLGCEGIVDPVLLAEPFAAMHDQKQVVFMELIETYLEWAQKRKSRGQPWTR